MLLLVVGWGVAAAAPIKLKMADESPGAVHLSSFSSPTYWLYQGQMPSPLTRHALVAVGSDFYLMGGQTDAAAPPVRTLTRYDTLTGQWHPLAPIPVLPGTCLNGHGYAATDAAYLNGNIYLPAGYAGESSSYCGVHLVYNLASSSWLTATAAPWSQPLGWSQVVEWPSLNGYLVMGGLTGPPLSFSASSAAYLFVPGSGGGTWFTLPTMTIARYGHAAAWVGDKPCVAGGINASNQALTQAECFNPDNNSWYAIPPLNLPRFNAASAVGPDGRWYVFGGTSPTISSIAPIDVYDPATNSWSLLPSPYNLGTPDDPLRPPRAWLTGDFVGDSLWVFGGEADTGVFNQGLPLGTIERILSLTIPPQGSYLPLITSTP